MIVYCVFTNAPADNDLVKIFQDEDTAKMWVADNQNDKWPREGKWAQYAIYEWNVE